MASRTASQQQLYHSAAVAAGWPTFEVQRQDINVLEISQILTTASAIPEEAPSSDSSDLNLDVPLHEEPEIAAEISDEPKELIPASTSSESVEQEPESDEGEIEIQIRNVVCNYTLPLHIDLRRIAMNSGNVTFDRGRGVLLKQKRNPSCYVKIYSSGKVYLVGCRSESECKSAARGVARMIQKIMKRDSNDMRIRNYRICNVLATCKLPFGIRIEELAQKHQQNTQYEPELSVGLIWRSINPKATLRIHTTGSITVTGAVSESDVMKSIEMIYPIVKEFRCVLRFRDEEVAFNQNESRKRQFPTSGDDDYSFSGKRKRAGKSARDRRLRGYSEEIGSRIYFSDEDDFDEDDEF